MQERRRLPRIDLCKSARIALKEASCVIDCKVRNLTNDGACLQFEITTYPDNNFTLSFDNFRSTRTCEVAWRHHDRLGVSFR